VQWDAGTLPLDASSIDKVATNLPFGRQVSLPADIPDLYRAIVRWLCRVVAPAGCLVALTDQIPALRQALDDSPLQIERVLPVSLKGLHPSIVVARR